MPFCQKCGNNVNKEDKFCHNCGASLSLEVEDTTTVSRKPTVTEKGRRYLRKVVLTFVVLEVVAIIGAFRLIEKSGMYGVHYKALWDNWGALAGFLTIAAVLTIFHTRHEPNKVRVGTTFLIVGALVATALGVKALN